MTVPVSRPEELLVDLDVFHGPFDLLITLVLREEIDLWEVSVSRIVADYLVRLADSPEFDLEATSQFVVLVAALLEMKSRLLLQLDAGTEEEDLTPEAAGEELLVSLVRYQQFRAAAAALAERWAVHAGRIYRQAPLPERFRRLEASDARLPATALAAALEPLLREPVLPDSTHITAVAVSLVAELRRLRELLDRDGSFTFLAVAPRGRIERAITFFALLELHNRGEAHLHQPRPFADITVRCRPVPVAAAG